jgi:hypothetical protein
MQSAYHPSLRDPIAPHSAPHPVQAAEQIISPVHGLNQPVWPPDTARHSGLHNAVVEHSPGWSRAAPARSRSQSFPYVTPSQPHTGSQTVKQPVGRGTHVPAASG